jgi:hypothetical protein
MDQYLVLLVESKVPHLELQIIGKGIFAKLFSHLMNPVVHNTLAKYRN